MKSLCLTNQLWYSRGFGGLRAGHRFCLLERLSPIFIGSAASLPAAVLPSCSRLRIEESFHMQPADEVENVGRSCENEA